MASDPCSTSLTAPLFPVGPGRCGRAVRQLTVLDPGHPRSRGAMSRRRGTMCGCRDEGGSHHGGAEHLPRCARRHPARASAHRDPRAGAGGPREARDAEPRRLGQGSDRHPHDRGRGTPRSAPPRRHDRRADLGQHRPRPGDRRRDPRLPLHLRDAGQDERREDRAASRLRQRGRHHTDGRGTRVTGVLLLGGRQARERDPRCVPTEPVLQPGQPADPRGDDGPGDLGADRRAASTRSSQGSAPAARSPARAATSNG